MHKPVSHKKHTQLKEKGDKLQHPQKEVRRQHKIAITIIISKYTKQLSQRNKTIMQIHKHQD
jgi:hypothetical protein